MANAAQQMSESIQSFCAVCHTVCELATGPAAAGPRKETTEEAVRRREVICKGNDCSVTFDQREI